MVERLIYPNTFSCRIRRYFCRARDAKFSRDKCLYKEFHSQSEKLNPLQGIIEILI